MALVKLSLLLPDSELFPHRCSLFFSAKNVILVIHSYGQIKGPGFEKRPSVQCPFFVNLELSTIFQVEVHQQQGEVEIYHSIATEPA